MRKKALSPATRRAIANQAVEKRMCSKRAACRILLVSRSSFHYRGREESGWLLALKKRIRELAYDGKRRGYRRIAQKLREEGWRVGKRRVQRLWRAMGMRLAPPRRKRRRAGTSTGLPTRAEHRGHVWTWDFISDATVRGGSIRILTILDEYTRECHVLRAERALKSADVLEWLGKTVDEHGAPEYLRSDNGSEFIAKKVQAWLKMKAIKTIYIEPGSPWQNGYVESFHGRFRDECLNQEQFWGLKEARVIIGDFQRYYNYERGHSSLGKQSPKEYAGLYRRTIPLTAPRDPAYAPVALRAPYAQAGQNPSIHDKPSTSLPTNTPGGTEK